MDGLSLRMTIHPFCEKFGLATVPVKVQDLLNYTAIDPMVQRKLSTGQRRKISNYLQERELERVFFGPVTLSLREVSNLSRMEETLMLRPGSKLSVLDGQHRILALGFVNEQLLKESRNFERKLAALKIKQRKRPEDQEVRDEVEQVEGLVNQIERRRLELMESELAVQIYIGLTEEEEKQLFGDINSKVQLVSKEIGHSFDSVDPINIVIQQVVEHNMFLKGAGVEKRANLTAYNKNFTSFSWLYSLATILFSGKMQTSYELTRKVKKDPTIYTEMLHQFFSTILPLMPEQPGNPQYTSSSRVVQESIAMFAHRYLFVEDRYNREWTSCLRILEGFDWSHENEQLVERFGTLDNGKLNMIHEKSLRKHVKLIQLFEDLLAERKEEEVSA
ncbi:DNA sulfur modification protein DndB [Paenibacillus thalictri]|uniref:DGQHR domain-containing protein n=1 Tax=Paenibacillus thalictri TaxID=2527873 RepID=A0A4Q9DFF2_9BACL|nr:DNA sulfur modification protein DndB [Paenibacillus thalictri]TBL69336.1 hypothetical protein EYB31_36360 [Paenibacillus thalictri]